VTELIVCTTCRTPHEGAGQALLEEVENLALARDCALPVRGVACLGGCGQGCTAALQAAGKHSYLFGGLPPDAGAAADLLEIARQHAQAADGRLEWAQRPERLKTCLLARLPPLLPAS